MQAIVIEVNVDKGIEMRAWGNGRVLKAPTQAVKDTCRIVFCFSEEVVSSYTSLHARLVREHIDASFHAFSTKS